MHECHFVRQNDMVTPPLPKWRLVLLDSGFFVARENFMRRVGRVYDLPLPLRLAIPPAPAAALLLCGALTLHAASALCRRLVPAHCVVAPRRITESSVGHRGI